MKSVGEAMAIGRTFKEALQKGLRSLEIKRNGLDSVIGSMAFDSLQHRKEFVAKKLRQPNDARIFYIGDALRIGMTVKESAS
jgi:carbamoyl-phosphate synthase large subunit